MTRIGRIWADEQELDRRTHRRSACTPARETQEPDSSDRGTRRCGQCAGLSRRRVCRVRALAARRLSATACRSCRSKFSAASKRRISDVRGVVMIPGSGEFVYATEPVHQTFDDGGFAVGERPSSSWARPIGQVSLDQLEASLAEREIRVARRQLVRHRSARRRMQDQARRRDAAQIDSAAELVGRRARRAAPRIRSASATATPLMAARRPIRRSSPPFRI